MILCNGGQTMRPYRCFEFVPPRRLNGVDIHVTSFMALHRRSAFVLNLEWKHPFHFVSLICLDIAHVTRNKYMRMIMLLATASAKRIEFVFLGLFFIVLLSIQW